MKMEEMVLENERLKKENRELKQNLFILRKTMEVKNRTIGRMISTYILREK